VGVFSDHHFTNIKAVFLFSIIMLWLKPACFWTSRTVNSSDTLQSSLKPNNHGDFRHKLAEFYATGGYSSYSPLQYQPVERSASSASEVPGVEAGRKVNRKVPKRPALPGISSDQI